MVNKEVWEVEGVALSSLLPLGEKSVHPFLPVDEPASSSLTSCCRAHSSSLLSCLSICCCMSVARDVRARLSLLQVLQQLGRLESLSNWIITGEA